MIRLRPIRHETGLWFAFWVVVFCTVCFGVVAVWHIHALALVSAAAAITSAAVTLWPKRRPSSEHTPGSTE